MKLKYNADKMATEIRTKRFGAMNMHMREAAKVIGLSPATLSRLENKKMPDAETLMTICAWLNQPAEEFFFPQLPTKKSKK